MTFDDTGVPVFNDIAFNTHQMARPRIVVIPIAFRSLASHLIGNGVSGL